VFRVALRYSAGLIALYLLVANATNSGALITAGSGGGVNVVKAFQGR
jgi:hypothetical protein